ncbi:MAG: SGNH/GDSL hydrolase family protein [Clostridia bacterium]|nr:SGNH/GDSL hydrolase family protein [Clostridia bacterium]
MPNIGEIDKNLKVETSLKLEDVRFYDVCSAPFALYGMAQTGKNIRFARMPEAFAETVSKNVQTLNLHTAGGRVRFSTDSGYIAIKVLWSGQNRMSHMPLTGQCGFDLYIDEGSRSKYKATFTPGSNCDEGYESVVLLNGREMRAFTINFPLYNGVDALYIGLQADAQLSGGAEYAYDRPVVYYGSSITQGGCASRPGNSYQGILSRQFNVDHVNLGFSGSARGEICMADYIAGLDPLVFVLDYDHNAPNEEHLVKTHEVFFRRFRELRPDTPVVMASSAMPGWENRRAVVFKTYENALRGGDKKVAFVDGQAHFTGIYADCATVDGCHPNDYGFVRMAQSIGGAVEKFLPAR